VGGIGRRRRKSSKEAKRGRHAHSKPLSQSSSELESGVLVVVVEVVEGYELCFRMADSWLLVPWFVCGDGHGEVAEQLRRRVASVWSV